MFPEYPKIESLYNRDEHTRKFIEGAWRLPEFAYLADNDWLWTEKVDGTNIRVMWDGAVLRFGGRTEAASIPAFLLARLQDIFSPDLLKLPLFANPLCLYGEGYGARIQKGGGNYKPDGVDFVLFDVRIGDWWLKREDVADIASQLGLAVVPIIGHGPLSGAVRLVKDGQVSSWGNFRAEGIVARPATDLCTRAGDRIIVKLKARDFAEQEVPRGAKTP